MTSTQRDLVLRARSGDHEAFTVLAVAAAPRMHRTARLILRNEERAADAVQDALVDAWVDLRALRDVDRFDAWLGRLLVRACYTEAGRTRRRSVRELTIPDLEHTDPNDATREVAVRDELERGFRRLRPEHRAVLVVSHWLGLRDDEAAEMLDLRIGTYKSRLHYAKAALRAALEAEERQPFTRTEPSA